MAASDFKCQPSASKIKSHSVSESRDKLKNFVCCIYFCWHSKGEKIVMRQSTIEKQHKTMKYGYQLFWIHKTLVKLANSKCVSFLYLLNIYSSAIQKRFFFGSKQYEP